MSNADACSRKYGIATIDFVAGSVAVDWGDGVHYSWGCGQLALCDAPWGLVDRL